MPRTVAQLAQASQNAQYVAQLNALARQAVADHLMTLVAAGTPLRQISRETRVSIGALRALVTGRTADVTAGTLIALAYGLGQGTVEGLLGSVGTRQLAEAADSVVQVAVARE